MKVSLKNIIIPSIPLTILLVIGFIGLWFLAYLGTKISIPSTSAAVNSLESFVQTDSLLTNVICIILTLLNSFLLAQINNRFTIIRTRTFLPVFTFLLLMASWGETHTSISANLGLTVMTFALFFLFSTSRDRKASEQAFMGSLFISISSLFISPLIFIVPICWIGLLIFQSFSLRTFLASIFGTLAPWVLFIAVRYLFVQHIDFSTLLILKPDFQFNFSLTSLPTIIYLALFTCFLIISIFGVFSLSNGDAINTRNKLNFLILLIVSLIVLAFIFRDQTTLFLPLIAMVFSLIFAHPFTLKNTNFYGISFAVFCFINVAYIISKFILI